MWFRVRVRAIRVIRVIRVICVIRGIRVRFTWWVRSMIAALPRAEKPFCFFSSTASTPGRILRSTSMLSVRPLMRPPEGQWQPEPIRQSTWSDSGSGAPG